MDFLYISKSEQQTPGRTPAESELITSKWV
jgi:hypothetical protein